MYIRKLLYCAVSPPSIILGPNRVGNLYWGTLLTLTCTAQVDFTVVDTAVSLDFEIHSHQNSRHLSTTNFEHNVGTASLSILLPSDNGTGYYCESIIKPIANATFIVGANNTSTFYLMVAG